MKAGTRVKWYDCGLWRKGKVLGPHPLGYLARVMPDDPGTINGEPIEEVLRWDELTEDGQEKRDDDWQGK